MTDVLGSSTGDRARDALARHARTEAYELLSAADAADPLPPDRLELLAEASWWTGRLPAAIDARKRAILVSAESLSGVRAKLRESGRRSVELKGFDEPVDVASIDWH